MWGRGFGVRIPLSLLYFLFAPNFPEFGNFDTPNLGMSFLYVTVQPDHLGGVNSLGF